MKLCNKPILSVRLTNYSHFRSLFLKVKLQKLFFLILGLLINCSAKEDREINSKLVDNSPFHFKQESLNDFFDKNQQYNTEISMFVDLGRPSNKKRFFVYNHLIEKTILSALVTHGSCNGTSAQIGSKYSNTESSYCSSLGKYKIGKSYYGKFGLAYKLHGLEESNSNAFNRFIVLHSHSCVPNRERTLPICTSQGCPTVSPDFLDRISPIIDNSDKPILLWLYDSTKQTI